MILQKIFSSNEGGKLYSVLMTEDEYRLFSKSNSRDKEVAAVAGVGAYGIKKGVDSYKKDKR